MRAAIARVFGRKSPVDQAQAAMEGLESLPTLQAMKSVLEWLGRQGSEDGLGLEVLVAIDGRLRMLIEQSYADVQAAHLKPARLAVLLQSVGLFCGEIFLAYSEALRREAGKMLGKPAQCAIVQEAAANWLFWSSRDHLLRHIRKKPCEAMPWGEIIALSQFVSESTAKAGSDNQKLGAVNLQLAHLLLLSRSIVPSLQGRMLLIADKIAASLAGFVALDWEASDAAPHAVVYAGNAAGTLLVNRTHIANRTLFFGMDRALQELAALETLIKTRHRIPQSLDPLHQLNAPEVLATIKHLQCSWSARQVKRGAQRKPAAGHLKAAHGFDTVRRLLMRHDQTEIEDLSIESQQKVAERIEALISQQEQQETLPAAIVNEAQGMAVERCEVQDISTNGLSFKLPVQREWAQIGQLVCVSAENRNAWLLVMIRRVYSSDLEEIKIGSELLSRKPEAVQLFEWQPTPAAKPAEGAAEYRWALYAPFESNEGTVHLLISSQPNLMPRSYYAAHDSTMGKIAFLIVEQHELGVGCISYRCKPVAFAEQ